MTSFRPSGYLLSGGYIHTSQVTTIFVWNLSESVCETEWKEPGKFSG